jgi:hypothetical protein
MKTLTFTLVLALFGLNLFSQTNFQGGIYSDTQWTKDKSPYVITGDVVVFPDKTLTIESGVEIKFNGNYYIEIRGILISIGNITSPISFTSNLGSPQKGDWVGLKIKNNQGAKASFEYCNFSFAYAANDVECCWKGGPIYFRNCKFESNINAMIGYTGDIISVDSCEFNNNTYCLTQADKKVTNSKFVGNDNGLYETERISVRNSIFKDNNIALYGGRGLVDSCIIENNNIGVKPFFEGFELRSNQISNNNLGVQLSNYDGYYPPIKNNVIFDNLTYNVENLDDINKDLTGNFWGTSDSTAIEEKLKDGYDNIYLGLFNYDIYNSNYGSKLKSVIKVNLSTGVFVGNTANIIKTYPNPFSSELYINFKQSKFENVDVSIYNTFGQNIYNVKNSGGSFKLSLDNLNSGIYILVVKSGSYIINKKIIKE